jgi:hypothetical protein
MNLEFGASYSYSKSTKSVATKTHKMHKKKFSVLAPFVPPCGYRFSGNALEQFKLKRSCPVGV